MEGIQHIETDDGEIELEGRPGDDSALSPMPRNKWRRVDEWLVHGGQRVLWLPPDVRPNFEYGTSPQYEGLFALGNSVGNITFIKVDPTCSPADLVPGSSVTGRVSDIE